MVVCKERFQDPLRTICADRPAPAPTNNTGGGDRARAFAFCAGSDTPGRSGLQGQRDGEGDGGVSVAMVNFDPHEAATFRFDAALGCAPPSSPGQA